jgi:hypothetical protein
MEVREGEVEGGVVKFDHGAKGRGDVKGEK